MHVVLEYVRNVLGVGDAAHQELDPTASTFAVSALSCSLAGQTHIIELRPGTRAACLYGGVLTAEPFFCSYGLDPAFAPRIEKAGLQISGRDQTGEARLVELPEHPFFIASLYVPQATECPHEHPLIRGFLTAVADTTHVRSMTRPDAGGPNTLGPLPRVTDDGRG